MEKRGLNLTGLGETDSESNSDSSECDDLLNCRHGIKKVEYIPKVDWREKVRQHKELVQQRQEKRTSTLPELKRNVTQSSFMMK